MTAEEFNIELDGVKRKDYSECLELSEDCKSWREKKVEKIKACPNNNPEEGMFERVVCQRCGGDKFEIIFTDSYETSGRCLKCGNYLILHTG